MSFPVRYVSGHTATGTADGLAAGTTIGGTALQTANAQVGTLSALATVDAETSTLTLAFKWQVSADNSTWVDLANGSQNAAAVVLATGTAGADAAVTRAFPAPEAVFGWQYVRAALVTGVTTGTTSDTYTLTLKYRRAAGF